MEEFRKVSSWVTQQVNVKVRGKSSSGDAFSKTLESVLCDLVKTIPCWACVFSMVVAMTGLTQGSSAGSS